MNGRNIMVIWLTPDNKNAFSSIWSGTMMKKCIDSLSSMPDDMQSIAYILAYYQTQGEIPPVDESNCPTSEEIEMHLFRYKVSPDDKDARMAVLCFLISYLDGKGLVLDLNQLIQSGILGSIVCSSEQVKVMDGLVTLPMFTLYVDTSAYEGNRDVTQLKCNMNLSAIHAKAFKNASRLSRVEFNDKLSYIGQEVFSGTSLLEVDLPKSVRVIEDNAFTGCRELRTVSLKEGLLTIGNGAFQQCTAITEIAVPTTCTTIRSNAFSLCNLVRRYKLPNVVEIGDYCFYDNRSLVEINLPKTLNKLGKSVFEGCEELKYIHIPASIPNLDKDAFAGIPKDCKIIVHTDSSGDSPVTISLYLNKLAYEVVRDA